MDGRDRNVCESPASEVFAAPRVQEERSSDTVLHNLSYPSAFTVVVLLMDPRFWMEMHTKPMSSDSPFEPLRGRYCLDSSCAKLEDANDYR